jgi:hypothetical protein
MNSTVIIQKIWGFIRKCLAKEAMVVGWQISDKVWPAPNDNRGLHPRRDKAIVLAVSPEGRKDSGKSRWIRFYKTGDEVFSVIFPTMKGRVYLSLTPARVVRPSGTEFSV